MTYEPQFTITPGLLSRVEEVTALRERILGASVALSWIPALQKDTRTRNVHASTAIEGNPLYYFALGGKKTADVPPSFIDSLDLSA